MEQVVNHTVLGSVTLSQTRRSRRISISVRPSGVVRLSFPIGVSARKAWDFLEQKVEWIQMARVRQSNRTPAEPVLPVEQARELVEQLRCEARVDLPQRIERLAKATGLRYAKLTIRASRTKWGSCSGRNNISLSLFLMRLPEHLRDYVIIHELCHTVHHNHSVKFHQLVDRCVVGGEKALNRELKSFTIRG